MDKELWTLFLVPALMTTYPACADFFQDQVTKSFRGFVIMDYEFDPDIWENLDSNPALVTGDFNYDKFEDFAALIRDTEKKRYTAGESSYDYYETRLVACHGLGNKKYNCTILSSGVTVLPEFRYLIKHLPGRTNCRSSQGDPVEVETEFIGWASAKAWATEGGGETQYIYQLDGSYLQCGTT